MQYRRLDENFEIYRVGTKRVPCAEETWLKILKKISHYF